MFNMRGVGSGWAFFGPSAPPSSLFRLIINNKVLTKFICITKTYFVRVGAHSFIRSKMLQQKTIFLQKIAFFCFGINFFYIFE